MTSESCEPIAELLIAYSDGELSAAEADRVTTHLAGCPGCREELQLLRRSLHVARTVWSESAAAARQPGSIRRRATGRPVPAVACAAACVSILLLAAGLWLFLGEGGEPDLASVPRIDGAKTVHTQVTSPPPHEIAEEDEDIDIQALIAREGRSAKLAAAARLLATQPGLERYRDKAKRYLTETYRGTAAAGEAAESAVSPSIKEPKS